MNTDKTISEAELKKALKGELDNSKYDGDILYYDELARGRVLNRMYKLLDKAFKAGEAQALERCVKLNKKYGAVPTDFRHWYEELKQRKQS